MTSTDTGIPEKPLDEPALRPPEDVGIGQLLREARQATSQSVPQIAARLRIKAAYIQALEDDRPENLPGRVYAIGFLRSYAAYLDLDPVDLIRRYKSVATSAAPRSELNFPKPTAATRQSPEAPAIIASALVIAAILFGWYYFGGAGNPLNVRLSLPETPPAAAPAALLPAITSRVGGLTPDAPAASQEPAPEVVAPPIVPPEVVVAPPPPPAITVVTPPRDDAAELPAAATKVVTAEDPAPAFPAPVTLAPPPRPDPVAQRSNTLAAAIAPKPIAPRAVEVTPPPPQVAALPNPPALSRSLPQALPSPPQATAPENRQATAPRRFGQINRDGRILLTARTDIWVQVRDADGADVFTRMLRTGESYRVPNRPGLRLLTGNAGALDVFVDGNAAPALGEFGTILRNVELDPDRLAGDRAALP